MGLAEEEMSELSFIKWTGIQQAEEYVPCASGHGTVCSGADRHHLIVKIYHNLTML